MTDTPEGEETPWAMVLRLRGEGATLESIVTALKARGLEWSDIELLLQDEIAAQRSRHLPPAPAPAPPGAPLAEPRQKTAIDTLPTRPTTLFAWSFLGAAGLALEVTTAIAKEAGWIPAVAASGVGALALFFLRKLPARRLVRGVAITAFMVTFLPTFTGFTVRWGTWQWVNAALLIVASAVWFLAKKQKTLRTVADFSPGATFESNDVQFRVELPKRQRVPLGGTVFVRVFAQNVVRAPRQLGFVFAGDTGTVSSPLHYTHEVKPGHVHLFELPVRLRALSHSWNSLWLGITGIGEQRGDRLVLEEGGTWVMPATAFATNVLGLATLAASGVGRFQLSSSGSIELMVDPDAAPVEAVVPATSKVVYEPRTEDLERATRS